MAANDRATFVTIDAPPSARDIRDAIVIKEGDLFLLTDLEGNVPVGSPDGFGLYFQDTRYLSGYELGIQGLRPTVLLSTGRSHFLGAQVLTNPNLVTSDGTAVAEQTVQIRRYRIVRPSEVSESLTVQNFNPFGLELVLSIRFEADFADMFEVRGLVRDGGGARAEEGRFEGNTLTFRRDGRDAIRRSTSIQFEPAPSACEGGTATYVLDLPARGTRRIAVRVRLHESGVASAEEEEIAPRGARLAHVGYHEWMNERASVKTSSEIFDAVLTQSRYDLRVLLSGARGEPFVAAGIPWYATLFGRDALLTCLFGVWESPVLSRHTLRLLARYQGTRDGADRDEEPGKIMHELRRGEIAHLGLVPFTPYYGTVDATPLWIMLLAEHWAATGELTLLHELRPNLEAALAWIDEHGDLDGDGFVEYRTRSCCGLANQGWKDSGEAIVHSDGTIAEPPIALVEAQAYVYAAKRGAALLYGALGDPSRAAALEREAAALADAFDRAFWMEDEGQYALALDGAKRQVRAITSNPGHALFAGIVPHEKAERVAHRLMAEDMFTGFGLRTLASHEAAFNPSGYHLGTVWPHDNAIAALGLKRYGLEEQALSIVGGMLDAAQHFPSYRMPELFCGFDRSAFGVPVRYPVACSPQAWAASAWSAFLRVMLGLVPRASSRELFIVRPRLPPWLERVEVGRVPLGDAEVDLRYQRVGDHTAVDVAAMRGPVRVTFVDAWDEID